MGFVGGGGNIAIATALPPYFGYFLYHIYYARQRLRFLDVQTNPGQRRPGPVVCRTLCRNVRRQTGNLSGLTVAV